jgi:hypothetical protein
LAATPVVAYLLTYVHEAGYCTFFGIPHEFISPSLTTVFVVASSLASFGIVLLWSFDFIVMRIRERESPFTRRFFRLLPLIVLVVASFLLYFPLWRKMVPAIAALAFFTFGEFIFPLLTQRNKPRYTEKLNAQDIVEARVNTLRDLAAATLGVNVFRLLIVLAVAALIAYALGTSRAMRQVEYLVPVKSADAVVLRIYADKLITAQFNRQTRTTEKSFKLLGAEGVEMRLEKVGPLKPNG